MEQLPGVPSNEEPPMERLPDAAPNEQPTMEQLPGITPSAEPAPPLPEIASPEPGKPPRKIFGIVLLIAILVLGIGTTLWLGTPYVAPLFYTPTPTATPTPIPGVGVPVRGGGWEVKITKVHRETKLKVGSGFTERSWGVEQGYIFLVVDVIFRQLSSLTPTPAPAADNVSATAIPASFEFESSVSSNQVALLGEDGTIITSAGAIFNDIQIGDICENCNVTLFTQTGHLEVSIVFVVKKDAINGKTFKFQFREVPLIPFVVK